MKLSPRFARLIRPVVKCVPDAAARHESLGEFGSALTRREGAQALGQAATVERLRVHGTLQQLIDLARG